MRKQYAVECVSKIASDCIRKGEYFDSEEEAKDWVESECWIFAGEGWICLKCHDASMGSLTSLRKKQGNGLDGSIEAYDGLDNDLETGIDIVR